MGDILIIGAGFAGLQAARTLSKNKARLNARRVLVVDAKTTFDFLPLLPDVAGRRIKKDHVGVDIGVYLRRLGVNFQQGRVERLDLDAKEAHLANGHVLSYEFLLLACGSETNFFGAAEAQRLALKLDSADDAQDLVDQAAQWANKKILVVGGGYTGIEVATNLAVFLRSRNIKKYQIAIVERTEEILGPLPDWMKDYCRLNLCRLKIAVHVGCSIAEMTKEKIRLTNGLAFEDTFLIWAAGVQTPGFVRDLPCPKDRQGRLAVDKNLKFSENCFAAGDVASFVVGQRPLRMAVQFSLAQADVAAKNISCLIAGRKPGVYRSLDLGYFVPMANRKACGKVLGVRCWGFLGWSMHYLMCVYRSLTFKNQWGVFRDVFLRFR
ncbi:MAG: FAD-dependent oxidoreductase [Candidatus Omnitrophota bacterium]